MPKIEYQSFRFAASTLKLIETCNTVIREYQAQGFILTLRQLYYQMVSRDIIANKVTEYKRLGSIVNDARLAGLIDWSAIEDRGRNLSDNPHWETPSDIVETCARAFRIDKWADQKFRPEVWIEKDALAGVIEPTCQRLDIPYIACKGYMSQSEMWVAGCRMARHIRGGQTPIVFHLGDHDPSGKDMTRDIASRLEMFIGGRVKLDRLALNMDQVEQYTPPPNPAKQTDSRFAAYLEEFGDESWELDALEPTVLARLITEAVEGVRDNEAWEQAREQERLHRGQLAAISANWEKLTRKLDVNAYLEDEDEDE
jgi:hypothetical protein